MCGWASSSSLRILGQELHYVIHCVHAFALLLTNLQVEFPLGHKVQLHHVKRVHPKLSKRGTECDVGWVFARIVQCEESDYALANVHGVCVVLACDALHNDIIWVVASLGNFENVSLELEAKTICFIQHHFN